MGKQQNPPANKNLYPLAMRAGLSDEVLGCRYLTPPQKVIFWFLSSRCFTQQHLAFPSHETIHARTGVGLGTIPPAVRRLEELGLITRVGSRAPPKTGGRGSVVWSVAWNWTPTSIPTAVRAALDGELAEKAYKRAEVDERMRPQRSQLAEQRRLRAADERAERAEDTQPSLFTPALVVRDLLETPPDPHVTPPPNIAPTSHMRISDNGSRCPSTTAPVVESNSQESNSPSQAISREVLHRPTPAPVSESKEEEVILWKEWAKHHAFGARWKFSAAFSIRISAILATVGYEALLNALVGVARDPFFGGHTQSSPVWVAKWERLLSLVLKPEHFERFEGQGAEYFAAARRKKAEVWQRAQPAAAEIERQEMTPEERAADLAFFRETLAKQRKRAAEKERSMSQIEAPKRAPTTDAGNAEKPVSLANETQQQSLPLHGVAHRRTALDLIEMLQKSADGALFDEVTLEGARNCLSRHNGNYRVTKTPGEGRDD